MSEDVEKVPQEEGEEHEYLKLGYRIGRYTNIDIMFVEKEGEVVAQTATETRFEAILASFFARWDPDD